MLSTQIPEKQRHLIIEHVNLTNDKLIWVGHPQQAEVPPVRFFFIATFVVLVALSGLLSYPIMLIDGTLNSHYLVEEGGIFNIVFWLLSIVIIITYLYYHNNRKTMIYGITERKVFWLSQEWKATLHEIDYRDIVKIDLVGRLDDPTLFTIYFTPAKQLNFYGYNYDKQTTRPFPTFELVKNGDQVFQQLNRLLLHHYHIMQEKQNNQRY